MSEAKRLLVVSNRLPVTLTPADGGWQAKASSGGLATAMEPILKERGGLWIGWAGDDGSLAADERDRLLDSASQGFSFVAVHFPPGEGPAFYTGYSNRSVWPLFHVFPSRMDFEPGSWRDYVNGNRRFADRVAECKREGDLIWIHDYHLMLAPAMLRERDPGVRAGFFLHIPFPSSEVFSLLPHGDEVLEGLLGADLIGFHTHNHLQNFRTCLLRILGIESTLDRVEYRGHVTKLQALPIGIDPDGFESLVKSDETTAEILRELRREYDRERVLIAVDRLDYTKGIPERFRAWRALLKARPELRQTSVLIQVAVPSREDIDEYQDLSSQINELAGEINGEFGTPGWHPIVYLRHSIERPNLAALYAVSDVAWVTPLRDGMNLVAKEYCACKVHDDGILVLSQFAGAAAEMGEALLVNPYDEEQVANAIERALRMPPEERARRMSQLRERVARDNVFDWAERFLKALETVETAATHVPLDLDAPLVAAAYRAAEKRLLIFDYDGTLVRIVDDPTKAKASGELIAALSRLSSDTRNVVAVISGRVSGDLANWLGSAPGLLLAAEHGALVRRPGSSAWETLAAVPPPDWKARIRRILQHYVDRAPGSFIEEKEYSVVWHYGHLDPEFGGWLASELTATLDGLLSDTDARPVRGKRIVEVRPVWANKGLLTAQLLDENPDASFRLAVGDDTTDEDIFARLDAESFTVRVGRGYSLARFRVPDSAAVLHLIQSLGR
ncbi:MAG TPA: bifunctional alpha,alpha-trehalose-phosphate synthase (UDP-forming)/trehalose-phosphatase [Bryobacteraceae bacterium]